MNRSETIRRPKHALRDTLSYLTTTRHHRPTTVTQAARDLRVSRSIAASRLSKLVTQNQAERVGRGKYQAPGPVTTRAVRPTVARALPGDAGAIQKRLAALREEREAIEKKIALLTAAMEIL